MDYNPIVAANIRRIRRSKDYTQEVLAASAGISSQYLSKIEREVSSPTVNVICKLAEALEVSPMEFFNSTDFETLTYVYTDLSKPRK